MSLRSRAYRVVKKVSSVFAIVAGSGLAYELFDNDFDYAHLGICRIGRAGLSAALVAVDYKYNFWVYRDLPPDSKEWLRIKSQIHQRSADRLLKMCCANAGGFIKVGQHVGSLEYLLPPEYVKTFKVLHSDAPRSPLPDLFGVVRADLGREPAELFRFFNPEPLGTASLAQVHRAQLFDGREVAVKIQHPRVKKRSDVDIFTMTFLIGCVTYIFPEFEFGWLAEETKKNLPLELDFLHEGRNAVALAEMMNDVSFLKVPKIHWDLSTDRVLMMEYCPGVQVDDREGLDAGNIPVEEVTRKLGEIYSRMIFTHGFVHCDPHPGNVLIHREDGEVKVILLDHGLYQNLTDEFRIDYAKLWLALINGDEEAIKEQADRLNAKEAYGLLACVVAGRSWESIKSGVGTTEKSSEEIAEIADYAGKLVVDITHLLNRVPRQLLLLFKTNDLLRGIEASLAAPQSASSFINMSRVCVKAIGEDEKKLCGCGFFHGVKTSVGTRWTLAKIYAYEWWLRYRGR